MGEFLPNVPAYRNAPSPLPKSTHRMRTPSLIFLQNISEKRYCHIPSIHSSGRIAAARLKQPHTAYQSRPYSHNPAYLSHRSQRLSLGDSLTFGLYAEGIELPYGCTYKIGCSDNFAASILNNLPIHPGVHTPTLSLCQLQTTVTVGQAAHQTSDALPLLLQTAQEARSSRQSQRADRAGRAGFAACSTRGPKSHSSNQRAP